MVPIREAIENPQIPYHIEMTTEIPEPDFSLSCYTWLLETLTGLEKNIIIHLQHIYLADVSLLLNLLWCNKYFTEQWDT